VASAETSRQRVKIRKEKILPHELSNSFQDVGKLKMCLKIIFKIKKNPLSIK